MKYIQIPNSKLNASEISLGCMRISAMSDKEISTLPHRLDEGINFFDMPISTGGKSDARYAEAWACRQPARKMILQSNWWYSQGPVSTFPTTTPGSAWTAAAAAADRLPGDDLLPRPDALVDRKVAEAFTIPATSGKVQ